ncbi:MAG: DNA primase [Citromicrobium sp.]|nr:MAG: DNA primase [Citromicrobium sp.]
MALTPQWLDELRMRTTLSAVIGRTVRLTKAGREFKACCPFHNEKTPSFYVNDEKGFYHCFGCEAHGDAIRWLTDQRGLPFMDAVKELAAEAGMEVPAPDPRAAERAEKRASLHDVTAAAQQWFVDRLKSGDGAQARAYLKRRGFADGVVRDFGFGFAPSERQALKGALSFDESMLVEAGMRVDAEDGENFDRFRGRLMLPIQDARGRVIAFGGRILDAEAHPRAPKYLNSPETPLFDKGRTLFNLHRAAPAARRSGRMVVVEGYMDVIALANAGIAEAVAPLGTALTENQIELLWRQVECPLLCFDGDNAGQRAAMRAIARALPMLRPGHSLAIVHMPPGLDPDDLLRDQGKDALERLLAAPVSLLDALWEFERGVSPLASPEQKAGLKARLLDHVEAIQHPDIRALYKRDLLDRFSSYAFPPRKPRNFDRRANWRDKAPVPAMTADAISRLKRAIAGGSRDMLASGVMHGLLRFPDQLARHETALLRFAAIDAEVGPAIDSLLSAAETLDSRDEWPISQIEGLPAPPENIRFAFLDKGTDPVDAREDLAEAVSLLVERPALDAALAEATARFEHDPEGAFAEQQRLLRQKLEFEARLGQMASRKAAAKAARQLDAVGEPDPGAANDTD